MRIRTLLTAALLAALPLLAARMSPRTMRWPRLSPASIARRPSSSATSTRHPQEVLEFVGIKPTHDRRRDLAGRRLLDRDPRPVPAGQGHVLHGDCSARARAMDELEQEARRQQGALRQGQGHRVRRRTSTTSRRPAPPTWSSPSATCTTGWAQGFADAGVRRVLQGAEAGRHPGVEEHRAPHRPAAGSEGRQRLRARGLHDRAGGEGRLQAASAAPKRSPIRRTRRIGRRACGRCRRR